MKITLKRLDGRGVAHHLLIAVIAVTFVAGFGAYRVFFSKAATMYETRSSLTYLSQSDGQGCWLAGRNFVNGACAKTCRSSGSTFVAATTTHLGYCTGAVAVEVSQSYCNDIGRRYISGTGCARKIEQVNDPGAKQCIYSSNTYIANNGGDHCAIQCSGQWLNNKPECPPAPVAPTAPTPTPTATPTGSNATPTTPTPTPTATPTGSNATGSPAGIPDDGTGDDNETAEVITTNTSDNAVVTVETDTKHNTCVQLLGREWIPAKKIKKKTTPAGCSSTKCHNDTLKIVQNPNGADYCQGYMAGPATTNAICDKLHRVWVSDANRCAQNPNQKKVRDNGAKQCVPPYTVYVFHDSSRDECQKPSTVQKAQHAAATATKNTVGKATGAGSAVACRAQGKSYVDGKCSSIIKKANAVETTKAGGGPSITANTCAKVHRQYFSKTDSCAYSEKFGQDKGSGLCSPDNLYYWHYASSKKDECKTTKQPTVFSNMNSSTSPTKTATSTVKPAVASSIKLAVSGYADKVYTSSQSSLPSSYNDKVYAVTFSGPGSWLICEDSGYGGKCVTIETPGRVYNLHDISWGGVLGIGKKYLDNNVSSIKLLN